MLGRVWRTRCTLTVADRSALEEGNLGPWQVCHVRGGVSSGNIRSL